MVKPLLHANRTYSRARLTSRLDALTRRSLVVVSAPAGYGKTTAVADYLASSRWEYTVVWLRATEAHNHPFYFWQKFEEELRRLGATPPPLDADKTLEEITPGDALEALERNVAALTDDLRASGKWGNASRIAIVLDDFHLIHSASILHFVAGAAKRGIRKLRIFVVARNAPAFGEPLGRTGLMEAAELAFNRDEILGWLQLLPVQYGVNWPQAPLDSTINALTELTGGRASAIEMYLALAGKQAGDIPYIAENLALDRIFLLYDKKTREFLMRVSVLEEYPSSLCAAVAGCTEDEAEGYFAAAASVGVFVFEQSIHHIFRAFLREKFQAENPTEWREALSRATEWYRSRGGYHSAANCCLLSGDYRTLARILSDIAGTEENMGANFNDFRQDEYILRRRLFDHLPIDILRQETPMLEFMRIFVPMQLGDMESAKNCIREIREHYEPMPPSPVRNRVLGELELMMLLFSYNDFSVKDAAFMRAWDLLQGPSILVSSTSTMIFSSHSLLLLYYNERMPLDRIVFNYTGHWKKHSRLMNMRFDGLGELLRAETAYERGDFETARGLAEESLSLLRLYDTRIAAHFLIARAELAIGDFSECFARLSEIIRISKKENKNWRYSTVDFCLGTIGAMLSEPRLIPGWIRSGDLGRSRGLAVGIGTRLETYPYTFALAAGGRCEELERALPEIREGYEKNCQRMGILYAAIYDVIVRVAAGDEASAAEAFLEARRLAEPDGLVMPFVERSAKLYPLAQSMLEKNKKNSGDDPWLADIVARMKERNRILMRVRKLLDARLEKITPLLNIPQREDPASFAPLLTLSHREVEAYALCAEGLSRPEIEKRLGVRPDNLKNILSHIAEKIDTLQRPVETSSTAQ